MLMVQQFRAKAAEYRQQIARATEPSVIREFEELERSFTELADNAAWLADNSDKTLHAGENDVGDYAGLGSLGGASLAEERDTDLAEQEKHILRRLGVAIIMQWNTLPRKLRKDLFDGASSMKDAPQTSVLRGKIARFLHKHKNDKLSSAKPSGSLPARANIS
jgi:hypothetical protein